MQNPAWNRAPNGTEILIRVTLTQESNDPSAHVGKSVDFVTYK